MSEDSIVVTGMGAITPLGCNVTDLWEALKRGQSGVGQITTFPTEDLPSRIAASVRDFDPEAYLSRREARRTDRSVQFAVGAASLAFADAGLGGGSVDPRAMSTCIGSGAGCLGVIEAAHRDLLQGGPRRVSPFLAAMMLPSMPAAQVSIQLGLKGPCLSSATACATGLDNLSVGMDLLRRGAAEVVLAGGTDSVITPLGMSAFSSARALSRRNDEPERASRPFDRHRDGFVMGEGAGVLVLERREHALARGARIYARVLGYGATSDAFHITAPREDGDGLITAMQLALGAARLSADGVHYVNTHGTSTPLNDVIETRAIKTVFGRSAHRLVCNSTKSMIGHLLGAAGAVELIVTILSLQSQFVHPTINLEEPDAECDLDYTALVGRPLTMEVAMCNSLAFGGHNASIIVGLDVD